MHRKSMLVTEADMSRLHGLLGRRHSGDDHDQEHVAALFDELARASVVRLGEMPADVVTMNSRVRVRDPERRAEICYTLVLPGEADAAAGRLSVLAPLGTALLGRRAGDEIIFRSPAGVRRLRIQQIVYQPEAEYRQREGIATGCTARDRTDAGANC